ncbi:MAG: biopolymer transporter ExbD, partial [Gammaproteobacteria bacterium]|nr:biopolymer transporter ExbD [Gammaproteobacteria bacterium]
PFLLASAVFSRITILELNMPEGAGPGAANPDEVTLEVVIRKEVMEISDGRKVIVRFAKIDNPDPSPEAENQDEKVYDLIKLTNYLLDIKANYPDKTDSTILMEPDIEYRHLVSVMDAMRNVRVPQEGASSKPLVGSAESGEPDFQTIVLFPDISIGDAP